MRLPTLAELLKLGPRPDKSPASSHFMLSQWIHPSHDWGKGTRVLQQLFPKETRIEKPREWYASLQGTHWVGQVPPGNGPFYVPDWALNVESEAEATRLRTILKGAGFKQQDVPVAMLPITSEYLRYAMRIATADDAQWTVDPVIYQLYWYPGKRGATKNLRAYTTVRWEAPR